MLTGVKSTGAGQVWAAEGAHDGALDRDVMSRVGSEFGVRGAVRRVQRAAEMAEPADLVTEMLGGQPHDLRGLRAPGPAEQHLAHCIEEVEGNRVPGPLIS